MDMLAVSIDVASGWCVWSLGHNLGHRWWHQEMKRGMQTFYAHGERQHHVVYDRHGETEFQRSVDPKELFISFPLPLVATAGLLFVAGFGYLRGWDHVLAFSAGLYTFMVLDHQLHIIFHKRSGLTGLLGWFQRMHLIHHATHNRNFFFVSGIVWDVLFRTAATPIEAGASTQQPLA
jgi:hypothetical protein